MISVDLKFLIDSWNDMVKYKRHHYAYQPMKMLQHQNSGWFIFSKKTVQSLIFNFQAGTLVPHLCCLS